MHPETLLQQNRSLDANTVNNTLGKNDPSLPIDGIEWSLSTGTVHFEKKNWKKTETEEKISMIRKRVSRKRCYCYGSSV